MQNKPDYFYSTVLIYNSLSLITMKKLAKIREELEQLILKAETTEQMKALFRLTKEIDTVLALFPAEQEAEGKPRRGRKPKAE